MIRIEKKETNKFVLYLDLGYPIGEFLGRGRDIWEAATSLCFNICETVWAPVRTLNTLKAWYPKKKLDLVQCHILNACKVAEEDELGVMFGFETSPDTEKQIPFCGGEGLPEIMRMFKAGYPLSVVHTEHNYDGKRVITQYCPKRLTEKADFYMMAESDEIGVLLVGRGESDYDMRNNFLRDIYRALLIELGEQMEVTPSAGN